MSIGSLFVPPDATIQRKLVGFGLIGLLFLGLFISGLINRKIGFKLTVWDERRCFERDKQPISYWLVMAFYAAGVAVAAYRILQLSGYV